MSRRFLVPELLALALLLAGCFDPAVSRRDLLGNLPRESVNLEHDIRQAIRIDPSHPVAIPVSVRRGEEIRIETGMCRARPESRLYRGGVLTFRLAGDLLLTRRHVGDTGERWKDGIVVARRGCRACLLQIEAVWLPADPKLPGRPPLPKAKSQNRVHLLARSGLFVSRITAKAPPPRTLMVLLADALRADALSCYGSLRATSPHLDRMSRSGVVFRRAIASATWTRASVAGLFTGQLPYDHGAMGRNDRLGKGIKTLAEELSAAGIATQGIVTNGNIAAQSLGFYRGFDRWRLVWPGTGTKTTGDKVLPVLPGEFAFCDKSERFLYLHIVDPHAPYVPPFPFGATFSREAPGTVNGSFSRLNGFRTARSRSEVAHVRALYDEEVLYTDWLAGRIVSLAKRQSRGLGLAFLSDHGESFWDHRAWEHGTTVFGNEAQVPLIVTEFGHGTSPLLATAIDPRGDGRRPVSLLALAKGVKRWFGLQVAGSSPYPIMTVQKLDKTDLLAEEIGPRRHILKIGKTSSLSRYLLARDPGETHPERESKVPDTMAEMLLRSRPGTVVVFSGGRKGTRITLRGAPAKQLEGCLHCRMEANSDEEGGTTVTLKLLEKGGFAFFADSPGSFDISIEPESEETQGEATNTIRCQDLPCRATGPPAILLTSRGRNAARRFVPTDKEREALQALGYLR